jgi:cobalt-zinc-cadmium efflux system outer membrane protein
LAKSNIADSLGNRTDIYLQNPEIGFDYLFGSPVAIGNRTGISVSQSFDFQTAYLYKSQISDLKNEQLNNSYHKKYREIVLQAKLICTDLIYYNLLIKEYEKRYEHAQKIATAYKSKYDIGDASIIAFNKAQLNKLNTEKELENLQIEKNALLNELVGLNGNIPISFNDTIFYGKQIPLNFEQWYAGAESRNPLLKWLKLEIELSEKQSKLNMAQSLPKFSAGYMSEITKGENFQGITVGISLPLWANKNKVKYAKLKTEATQNYENASKLKYYNLLKTLHAKAVALQKSVDAYNSNLQMYNNSKLLYKALEKGELDLINYIMELSFYYESYRNLLDMKRELYKVVAEMYQY